MNYLLLIGGWFFLPLIPVGNRAAVIESVRAVPAGGCTLLDIAIKGASIPAVAVEAGRLVITLPNAQPDPRLAERIATGGLVSRLAIESPASTPPSVRLNLTLSEPSIAELTKGPDRNTARFRIAALNKDPAAPAAPTVRAAGPRVYDLDATQSDVAELLKSLARDSGVNLVLAGSVSGKVSVALHQVTVARAIDYVTKSAGLAYHHDAASDTYLVGAPKDIEAAYPTPKAEPIKPQPLPAIIMRQEVYRCRHIVAADVVTTFEKLFDKETLKVSTGASPLSPKLEDTASSSVTGVQSKTLAQSTAAAAATGNPNARDLVFYGEESAVERAIALARKMDVRRAQVQINVRITDFSVDALRELGVKWNWSNFTVHERAPSGINFGSFTRDPVFIDAAISAMENDDRAKLLASPSLSLLDGERGFILIGDKLLFPKLIGYTQAQTPIFDKDEERVGIYLQVAVQMAADGEITLTIYPQVSVVTSFLTVNGASYPQISTREQQTTIRVKDGQKIVVGGLIRDEDLHNVQRVPILSRVPLFGELFTYRKKTKRKSEVVITITPQIIKD